MITQPPSMAGHADRLAKGWVDRVNELMEATNCPLLVAMHIGFWLIIVWLLLWPAGGSPKTGGVLSGALSHRGLILRLIDKVFPPSAGG